MKKFILGRIFVVRKQWLLKIVYQKRFIFYISETTVATNMNFWCVNYFNTALFTNLSRGEWPVLISYMYLITFLLKIEIIFKKKSSLARKSILVKSHEIKVFEKNCYKRNSVLILNLKITRGLSVTSI